MHVVLPEPVKAGVTRLARRQRQSTSQLVTVILEDWLLRRGELIDNHAPSALPDGHTPALPASGNQPEAGAAPVSGALSQEVPA